MSAIKVQAEKLILQKVEQLQPLGFTTTSPIETQFAFEISVKKEKEKFKLLTYFGKKGIKLVLQGNQELEEYKSLSEIIFGEQLFLNTVENEPEEYIGIDESGKGDYFGPLVICGVAIDNKTRNQLSKLNVVDSKQLSNGEIKKVSVSLQNILSGKFDVIQINPEKYNQLYDTFKNLNRLLAWGHAKVIENLLTKIKVGTAISDKFGNEKTLINSLQKLGREIQLRQETKAEKYLAVAAASIIARAKFLEWFDKTNASHKLNLKQGSSLEIQKYFLQLKKEVPSLIPSIAKLHFKISEKLQ